MTSEFIYLMALSLIGLGLLSRHVVNLGPVLAAGASFPVGLAVAALAQLVLAIAGVKLNGVTIWLLVAALLAASAAWMWTGKPRAPTALAIPVALATAVLAVVVVSQSALHAAVLTYDSYDYLVIASNLYRPDTSLGSDAIVGFLNNYAPLLWLTHAPARLFNEEFLVLVHPAIFGFLLLTAGGLAEACTRDAGLSLPTRVVAAIVPLLVLLTTPQIIHHAVYVMPNLLTALMLTTAIACLWVAAARKLAGLVIPAAVCMAAMTIARQEGGLMAAMLIVAFAASDSIGWKAKCALAVFVSAISTLWYVTLIAITGPAADQAILTPMGAMLQIGCLWIAAAMTGATVIRSLRRPILWAGMSMPMVLLLAHIPFFVMKPAPAIESVGVFVFNAVWAPSLWGPWWGITLAVGALALATRDQVPYGRMMGVIAVSIVLLIDLLGIVRWLPYRLGDQDSGNRMLIHAFPIFWCYFAIRFALALRPAAAEREPTA